MAQLIDGKAVAAALGERNAKAATALKEEGIFPSLAVILVGDNAASQVYVRNKKRACENAGITSLEFLLPGDATQAELLELVAQLNAREDVSGILCQLPLPAHLDEKTILNAIDPKKDVDAFHPENVGHIMVGDYQFLPCTAAGIMELLDAYDIDPAGKQVAVIGRSNIVGKPVSMLLLHRNATVTMCHSRTQDLAAVTRQADILVAAVGKANFVTGDMIKPGATVIDVGINRMADGKLCGDVDFADAQENAAFITPVPGGVGPMTVAVLMKNTLTAAKINQTKSVKEKQ